jgi:tetratricopeptide (TPR) repeat protein
MWRSVLRVEHGACQQAGGAGRSFSRPQPVHSGSGRQILPRARRSGTPPARGTELASSRAVRILHVGNAHLVPPLRALGHEVIAAFETHADLARPGLPFDVRALWDRLPDAPDLLLVADMLGPQALPHGLEAIPVPRLYYAIDIHVNAFWQRPYGALFDLVLVAQKDWAPLFEGDGVPAHWLPWGVDETVFRERGLARRHDVCFIGTVDPANRPKRAAALAALRERFEVVTFGERPAERLGWEEMAVELASSRIVFNESIMGDLNFRVFEAMACGAFLLTERIGNGLTDLFTPGEHLDVYDPDDLHEKVAHYLAAETERARIAAAGARLVHEHHTMGARMRELVALVGRGVARRSTPDAAYAWGRVAHLAAARGLTDPGTTIPTVAVTLRAATDAGHAEAALALAEILAWAGKPDAALAALDEARRLDPACVRAWLAAAELERHAGRTEIAASLLRTGVDHAPDVTPSTRRLARAAIDAGVETAACQHALGLVLQESGHPFVPGFMCRLGVGLPRTALDYFVAALELDPTYAPAAESAARLLEFLCLPDFATQFFEALVHLAPEDVAAREDLQRILTKSYRFADAAYQVRVIAGLRGIEPPGTPAATEAAAALGEWALARIAARDWSGARHALERALEVAGEHRGTLAELLERLPREGAGSALEENGPR